MDKKTAELSLCFFLSFSWLEIYFKALFINFNTSDSQEAWKGLQAIIDPKSLCNNLNTFYSRFDPGVPIDSLDQLQKILPRNIL